ncbi:MAG: Integrase core domain, partial [Deltaproteobacteria bacterium]|nr:Integrase core domain [Deltaproteobacteria bacterium]
LLERDRAGDRIEGWSQGVPRLNAVLGDAAPTRSTLRAWQDDYNNVRLHSTLGNQTPAQFRAGQEDQPDCSEAVITRV